MEPMLTLMLVLVFKESAILYEDTKKILFSYFKVFYQVVSASLEHSIFSYTIAAPGQSSLIFQERSVIVAPHVAVCSRSTTAALSHVHSVSGSVDCLLDQVQIRRW